MAKDHVNSRINSKPCVLCGKPTSGGDQCCSSCRADQDKFLKLEADAIKNAQIKLEENEAKRPPANAENPSQKAIYRDLKQIGSIVALALFAIFFLLGIALISKPFNVRHSASSSRSYTSAPTSSSDDEGSFVKSLTGSDWHGFSNQQKQTACSIMSSRLQSKHPVATPAWLLRELDTYFRGGNGRSDKVLDMALWMIIAAENE